MVDYDTPPEDTTVPCPNECDEGYVLWIEEYDDEISTRSEKCRWCDGNGYVEAGQLKLNHDLNKSND